MRMSKLFSQTLRDVPAEVDIVSHQLLLRAGYIRQLGTGIFSYLPLAQRALTKIENIIRDEMDKIDGQEITMPVVHPASLWQESGRWYAIGPELTRFLDRAERDMVLSMTHEEVVADLARKEINSYKQLPVMIYQIQTKWRDEPRARGGLIRVREFVMKDSYSLDADAEGLDVQYRAHYQAYFNIFHRCGLPVISVASDVGMMGGSLAHEYMYITPIGEDTLMICDESGYAANREVARITKPTPEQEDVLELEKVKTPNTTTIEALAELLDIPKSRTAKAIFMVATVVEGNEEVEKFVFAVVRGDMDVNEVKLGNAVNAKALRPATEAEIRSIGAEPGYGSPVKVRNCTIVVDDLIPNSPNLVAGANEVGYHYKNVNYGREFEADIVADIVSAREGDLSPDGAGKLREVRGVEVGNIFKLGTRFSDALGATFLDQNGKAQPIVMGSYGIGVGRLLACVAEEYHDENGLKLPISIAPYEIHLISLRGGEDEAETLYAELQSAGYSVLYDDRNERPGVKFNDADLLGMPLRITISKRSLENGGAEFKRRDLDDSDVVALDGILDKVKTEIDTLQSALDALVKEVPYQVTD